MRRTTRLRHMQLCIQDPGWPQSEYLLERLIEAAAEADSGGGAFAFASAGGVKLLLEDEDFAHFLSRSPFDLIVGVDAITNLAALARLQACIAKHRRLTIRVLLSDRQDGLFHPKLCWFRVARHTVSLVGSGNLTVGGLRSNREAFTLSMISGYQRSQLHEHWSAWVAANKPRFLALDHPAVLDRARANRGTEILPRRGSAGVTEDNGGALTIAIPRKSDAVLIAEIPKSGKRWKQANFDLATFQSYFGATPGRTQRIILTHVDSAGSFGPVEVRPSVAVKSHNFRFELDAASGLAYPKQGRPIGVFVRVATRTFRYRLLMPGTVAHTSAKLFLDANGSRLRRRMRRLTSTVAIMRRQQFFIGLNARATSSSK